MTTHHNNADGIPNSLHSTNLADLLERLLDKGIVIAGDIKINLVEVELLTIQIRLIICSVDKAREMGLEWWTNNPAFMTAPQPAAISDSIGNIENRLSKIESVIDGARSSDAD